MKLFFRHFEHHGGGVPFVILHGLFGSSDNWQTLARRFATERPVYVLDQRNHGRSPHSEAFDYHLLAEDLHNFMKSQSIVRANLIGHSMGGKAVMFFAQSHPEMVRSMTVVDMGTKRYPPQHADVLAAFHAIKPKTLESRKQADDRMRPIIADFGQRQFLLKNLYRLKDGGYGIRANYTALENHMDDILEAVPRQESDVPSLFVIGERSSYVPEEDRADIRKIFLRAEFATLDTGHWVHAEDPDGFYDAVMEFETQIE